MDLKLTHYEEQISHLEKEISNCLDKKKHMEVDKSKTEKTNSRYKTIKT